MSVLWFFCVRVSSAGGLVAKKSNRKSGAFDSCKLAVHPTVWRQSEDGKGGTRIASFPVGIPEAIA